MATNAPCANGSRRGRNISAPPRRARSISHMSDRPVSRAFIGYVPEDRSLASDPTTRENIEPPMATGRPVDRKTARLDSRSDADAAAADQSARRSLERRLAEARRVSALGDERSSCRLMSDVKMSRRPVASSMQALSRVKATGVTIVVTDSDEQRMQHPSGAAFSIRRGAAAQRNIPDILKAVDDDVSQNGPRLA